MTISLTSLPLAGGGASGRWPVQEQVDALHECAHAVAAIGHGIEVEYVNLRECAFYAATGTPRSRGIVAQAGGIMTARFGQPMSDADSAILVEARQEAGVDILDRQWWHDAKAFVRTHETDIRKLAVALLERRTLTGEQCVAVLGEHWRPKPVLPPIKLTPAAGG
jgi:hypothetical protein